MSLHAPGRSDPFRSALRFTFAHWARQLRTVLGVALVVIGSTMADVLIPLFAGKLVDAVAQASSDHAAAVEEALHALVVILGLGLAALIFRHVAFVGVTAMTLRVMVDVAQEGFAQLQRFSTDWHANNFAGSTVRKLTRGMWALDQLHDTILIALLPSVVVLLGTTLLLGLHWPVLGGIVLIGSILFVGLTIALSLGYVSPAARLANGWDTRMGGALADAISCNPVVKAFGAESREDACLARVLAKWRNRTHRAWIRGTTAGTTQNIALLLLRAAVMGGGVLIWARGQASAGDVAFVLTSYTVVQGYLRDVGMHIHNLQRSVNDMEELVALSAMPLGVVDRPDARPIAIGRGRISFERVTFHYGQHAEPLYRDLTVRISAGEKVGLVGRSGSGKTTFIKLVQRLYDVTGGSILIDGQDISHATQASLRAADRDRPAGAPAVPSLARRKHRLWQAGCEHGRNRRRRAARERPCLHRAPSQGLRNARGRARRQALGRRAPAHRARPRIPSQCARDDPRRGDVEPRLRVRGADPGGYGTADGRTHDDRGRAPAVDG